MGVQTPVRNDEIVTFTGRIVRPLTPTPGMIDIVDIGHALSNNCRFTGHVRSFYSVAQHSVLASAVMGDDETRKWALLHDASEAYLSDLARPIKYQEGLGDIYRQAEKALMAVVVERFGLSPEMPDAVKAVDDALLRSEQRDLMPDLLRVPGDDYYPYMIEPWSPAQAKERFMETARVLNLT